jgi:hypothetical protein
MKERGILMSAPMVVATLRDIDPKEQTRRAVKPQPSRSSDSAFMGVDGIWRFSHPTARGPVSHEADDVRCPYGKPGDRLWVREAWKAHTTFDHLPPRDIPQSHVWYMANEGYKAESRYRHGMFMPRWASRITLEITDVHVERLQDISEADCVAEGIQISSKVRRSDTCYGIYECLMPDGKTHFNDSAYSLYRTLWEQINGAGSWAANPWVWVVEFKRVK